MAVQKNKSSKAAKNVTGKSKEQKNKSFSKQQQKSSSYSNKPKSSKLKNVNSSNISKKNADKGSGRPNGSSPVFLTNKKSKKAKSKQKKDIKRNDSNKDRAADIKVNRSNSYENLNSDEEDNFIDDSDDEIIQISSASSSDSENVNDKNESNDDDDDADADDDSSSDESEGENIKFIDDNSDNEDVKIIRDNNVSRLDPDIEDEPPAKKQKTQKLSAMDDDFIAFDFSSDDDEKEKNDHLEIESSNSSDDNEYLSNDEGSYHSKNINHKAGKVNGEFPWVKNNDHSKEREMSDWLTSEMKDFIKYISPSAEEIESRNKLIQNLRQHIKSIWPDAELHCFGSFATDLYLPGSDIDCVVISKRGKYDNKSALYQLTSYIRNNKLGVEVTPIAKAKVPIIKFIDPKTRIHIDISFEKTNGLTAAKLIIKWLKETAGLRELVLIIKQFLAARKLNEVHIGGLGGFSIICLVYSFLKLHPRLSTNNIDPMENLGCLLIEFFELYGYNFGYDSVALAFTQSMDPIYVKKTSNPELLGRNPFSLAIQDPHDPSNNISRGSFNLRDIKRSFGGAFELLVNKCYELQCATYKQRLGKSILGGIIKYKGKERDFNDARSDVKNVAFHAASTGDHTSDIKKKSGVLPLLPSEKAGLDIDEYYMSDSYYSDESDDQGNSYKKVFNDSQKKSVRTTDKKQSELLGIKDIEEDDHDYNPAKTTKKEPDFTDSEDENYDPSKEVGNKNISAAAAAAKEERREYWKQKGKSF